MGIRAVDKGAVSQRVAANMKKLREQHGGGMTLEVLARRMAAAGRPILKSGLSKVEQGDRRVDVDDLVAIAIALGVNPSRLLLPDVAGDEPVRLTDTVQAPAWAVWQWADGHAPLPTRGDEGDEPWNTAAEVEEFYRLARPGVMRRAAQHPLMRAAANLSERMRRVVYHVDKGGHRDRADLVPAPTVAAARRALERVQHELDEVEGGGDGQR